MLEVQKFKMALSKTMPEAFCVIPFNGNRENDGSKEPCLFIGRVSIAQLSREQLQNLHASHHCASLHSEII